MTEDTKIVENAVPESEAKPSRLPRRFVRQTEAPKPEASVATEVKVEVESSLEADPTEPAVNAEDSSGISSFTPPVRKDGERKVFSPNGGMRREGMPQGQQHNMGDSRGIGTLDRDTMDNKLVVVSIGNKDQTTSRVVFRAVDSLSGTSIRVCLRWMRKSLNLTAMFP